MVADVLDDDSIGETLSKMAWTSMCKDDHIYNIAAIIKKLFLDSDEVMSIMVQNLKLQSDKVVSHKI